MNIKQEILFDPRLLPLVIIALIINLTEITSAVLRIPIQLKLAVIYCIFLKDLRKKLRLTFTPEYGK